MAFFLTAKSSSLASAQRIEIVKNVSLAILFAIITAISSKIEIPLPPVPFTLQTLAVILSGVILGSRLGFLSQIMYLGMGLAGLPVFAHTADFSIGLGVLASPTGGYLLAFPIAAFIAGSIAGKEKSTISLTLSFIAGEAIILTAGMLYLNTFFFHDLTKSFQFGVAPFMIWTAAKIILGVGASKSWTAVKSKIKE